MYEYADRTYETIIPLNKKILMKKLKPTLDKKVGDIFVPYLKEKNTAIGTAEIIAVGSKITIEDGISIGDKVMYDYYSVYEDGKSYVLIDLENIIMKLTEEEAKEMSK